MLKKCPRLEELYLNTGLNGINDLFASKELGNLRVFQYYFGTPEYSRTNYTIDELTRLRTGRKRSR